ncbi:MAG TPA: hypothetical protein VHD91_02385 [Gaiellaceae bacterium]|nr:hypothetical protein [Gaiellaceae bacterium]
MGSRLLPFGLALAALAAQAGGLDGVALYVGLLAVPAAAAAAFVAISDVLDERPALLRASTSGLALLFVVVSSAVRESAAQGAGIPALATSALVGALIVYAIPVVLWVLEPYALPRARASARLRTTP